MSRRGGVEAERRARGDQTRRDIMAAGRKLFVDPGYFATGTNDIVTRAGVGTRGAFYHHFTDKTALFRAVFDEVEAALTVVAHSALPADSAWEGLVRGLHGFLEAALDPGVQRIIILDGPAVLGWEERRGAGNSNSVTEVAEVLATAMAEGTIDQQPPRELAHMLLAAVEEAALLIAHAPDPEAARGAADQVLDRLLAGLLVAPRRGR